jgi:hypothetical protein
MGSSTSPFTAIYAEWLDSIRAVVPGSASVSSAGEVSRTPEPAAASRGYKLRESSFKQPQ